MSETKFNSPPNSPSNSSPNSSPRYLIWDLPLRLFHWFLLFAMVGAIASAKNGWFLWHKNIGLFILWLLLFRILWGFFGSETARFSHFIKPPSRIWAYIRNFSRNPPSIGHNPLGGLAVLAMIFVFLLQAISGLFTTDDILFEAPFYPYISQSMASNFLSLHHFGEKLVFLLILLHLLAIGFYQLRRKHKIIGLMVRGYGSESSPQLKFVSLSRAGGLFLLAGIPSWGIFLFF